MDLTSSIYQMTGLSPITQTIVIFVVTLVAVLSITKKSNLPPGPTPLPLLGNALSFLGSSLNENITKWKKKYGSIVTFYMGPSRMVLFNDINSLNEAYVGGGPSASGRPFVHSMDLATQGSADILMASYGDLWKFQRKIAVQATRQYLTGSQLEERVHEAVGPVITSMLEQTEPFDPKRHVSLSVINVLNGICFGKVMKIDDEEFIKFVDAFYKLADLGGNGFLEDFFSPLRMWPSKKFQNFQDLFQWLNDYYQREYESHKADFDPHHIRDLTDNIILAKQQAEEDASSPISSQFTETHALQTLADVFGGGVDTTRTQISWIVLVLAARQDIQNKMLEEIDRVIGDKIPGKEHRNKLVYLEAVMMEAMRYYPVAPLGVPHETMKDMVVAGYNIPKSTTTVSNQMAILHDPANWEEPDVFKPERFLDESGTKLLPRPPSFIAFSLGNRVCLGEAMAKMQLIFTVAGLLQKLTFHLPDGVTADLTNNANGFFNNPRDYMIVAKSR